MASIYTSIIRLLPFRRRYTVVGLIACFAIFLVIYSSIPSHQLNAGNIMIRGAQTNNQLVFDPRRRSAVREWLVDHVPRPLVPAIRADSSRRPTPASQRPEPSSAPARTQAEKSRLTGGGDVYTGSLSQAVVVPYDFNISAERIAKLQENKMLFRQLAKEVTDTRGYLASVQPDFDVNSRACRCGRSISTECSCCAQLTLKRFLLEQKGCVNFTYVLKDQVLRVRLSYDKKLIASKTLTAARPPMLCAGKAVDVCAAFRNVSYKVQLESPDHKTSLSGCLDLLVRLNAMPIAIYPLGCFRSGRDPKLVHIDKVNNWVP